MQKGMTSKKIPMMLAGILFVNLAQAQESSNASGGNAIGSGGTVAYSIGQVVYTSNIGNNGTIDQGVQHAYEIFTVGINETTLNISLSVFPNPTTENLILQTAKYNNEKMLYQLLDIQGKQLRKGQIMTEQTQINTASLPAATYFINIINQENKQVQSFKIIKN